jgi:PmbA protein
MTQYLELAKEIASKAANNGVEVEILITEDTETHIRVSAGEVEQLLQSGSRGMGVRAIDDGRMGYAYTSDFSADSIEQTWRTALELAKVATPDEYRRLPDPQPIPAEDLQIWDADLPKLATDNKIALAKTQEKVALEYDKRIVMSQWCTYEDNIHHVYLANSRGFAGEYGRTVAAGYLMAVARGEGNDTAMAFGLGVSNFFRDLDPQAIGREAGEKAISTLGGKPVPTQTASVVLDPVVAGEVLAALAGALSAEAWQKKRSFLMDKLGKQVGNDIVTLMDNGRLPRGLASAPFDGEGVPTSATRLIDEGVLQNLIYDSYTARKAGVNSTGNAQRMGGHRTLPRLGPSNFYMQPGHLSQDEIIAGVENGLFVLNIMQTGGIDPITGDCSMGATGLWIENGKIVGPVNNVTIATTLDDFLMNITQVGSDMRMIPFFGTIGVPTLRVDNVTIGGTN